jgi:hypothetical protein
MGYRERQRALNLKLKLAHAAFFAVVFRSSDFSSAAFQFHAFIRALKRVSIAHGTMRDF